MSIKKMHRGEDKETGMEISNDGKTITLCGVQGCCPTVEYVDGGVELKDDHGGKVALSKSEWGELIHGVQSGQIQ